MAAFKTEESTTANSLLKNSDDDFQNPTTPFSTQIAVRASLTVPVGHLLVAEKWRGTPTVRKLSESITVQYSAGLGVIDFHPSGTCAVIFLPESEILEGRAYKKKLASTKAVKSVRKIVVVERTPVTLQHMEALQIFIVLELGFSVIPVAKIENLPSTLVQLVTAENRSSKNPYLVKSNVQPTTAKSFSAALLEIPKLGEKKVQLLMEKYSTLHEIANASVTDLSSILGPSIAQIVWDYFHV